MAANPQQYSHAWQHPELGQDSRGLRNPVQRVHDSEGNEDKIVASCYYIAALQMLVHSPALGNWLKIPGHPHRRLTQDPEACRVEEGACLLCAFGHFRQRYWDPAVSLNGLQKARADFWRVCFQRNEWSKHADGLSQVNGKPLNRSHQATLYDDSKEFLVWFYQKVAEQLQ